MAAPLTCVLYDTLITRVSNSVTGGTTAVDTSIIDMQDWDGVCFIACLGSVTDGSVLQLAIQENTANQTSGMAQPTGAITASVTASSNSNAVLVADIYRPLKRYVRAELTRTTQNAAVDSIVAIQYRGRVVPAPVTNLLSSVFVTGI